MINVSYIYCIKKIVIFMSVYELFLVLVNWIMSLFISECEILIVCMLYYNYFYYVIFFLNFLVVLIMISCK